MKSAMFKKGGFMICRACVLGLVLCCGLFCVAQAQFKEPGGGLHVGLGGVFGQNDDVRNRQVDFNARLSLRTGLLPRLQGEVGIGINQISGRPFTTTRPYRTVVIPVDARLLWSPFSLEAYNPFLYVGGGALHWKVQDQPPVPSRGAQLQGWTGYIPGGAGVQMRLSNNVGLEFSGGYNYTFTDDLDGIRSGRKDAFWSFLGGITFVGESAEADPDGDGLSNRIEEELNTDEKKSDSDGDGLMDGEEFLTYKTNPSSTDTDGDGLSDAAEVREHRTNPLKSDSDGDGLSDGDEATKHNSDPLKADTDADGLPDGDEVLKHGTNPTKSDTDGDGLSDVEEVQVYKTDPTKVDTDGDGLRDVEEAKKFGTNPLKTDTDGGTVGDGAEVARGLNPTDAADDVPVVGKPMILEGVGFKTGSAELTPESAVTLGRVYQTLVDFPDIEVEIGGHTDITGGRRLNINLSAARASAVKEYLVTRGIDGRRIRTVGYGPDRPAAPNTTGEGRAKNRRIEFTRIK